MLTRRVAWLSYRVALILVSFVLVFSGNPRLSRAETNAPGDPCHLAITVLYSGDGIDLSRVGVASFLNWSANRPSNIDPSIEHLKVLSVHNNRFPDTIASLPGKLAQYPGAVWLVGNEPDTFHSGQDNVTPEVYAERFYELANMIRSDPGARIGFAPIVQPSPLRLRYMARILARLDDPDLAGSVGAALSLIDIFAIHSFILNEQPGWAWGAGIPPGFETDYADAFVISSSNPDEMWKTYNIGIFSQWVTAYRTWMNSIGARNKPLWITEYGSLMPPLDPPGVDLYNVTDEVSRDYMLATFNFIYNTTSGTIGNPADGNRLVQRAYWYSLNESRTRFGGSLFDPMTKVRTIVGDAFVNYDPPVPAVNPDPYPISVDFVPLRYTAGSNRTRVDFRVDVTMDNHVVAERLAPVVVELTLDGVSLGTVSGYLPRCGGVGVISFSWNNVVPLVERTVHVDVTVNPASGLSDADPGNSDTLDLLATPLNPATLFLPMLKR